MQQNCPCETAIALLKDIKRTPTSDLPQYDSEKIRLIFDEIIGLFDEVEQSKDERANPYKACGLLLNHQAILRNKRALLIYMNERINRLQRIRWETRSGVIPEQIRSNVSLVEENFFKCYDQNLSEYMSRIGLDLTADLEQPPKNLFVEVRVIKEYGEFVTESGNVVLLRLNTRHFLPRVEVEPLIKQGYLQHIG
eukprot:TRINITY_DN463_c1_g1_i1.p1 TRINITY_DN463_c1_g1~~TRINITY_DN463_c1_g1_i1.p1  ORF type:complete len:195 (-),score=64.58 TRINITY_DN463_c1_g1_i1:21-605(-)